MKASLFRLVIDNEPGAYSACGQAHTMPPINFNFLYIHVALFRTHIMGRSHYDKLIYQVHLHNNIIMYIPCMLYYIHYVACHNGSVRRAGMAIGRRVQQRFVHVY